MNALPRPLPQEQEGGANVKFSISSCHCGFTLAEMAVVVVIMGLVMATAFPALTALLTGNQRAATQSNLKALMTATAAFAQANGCIPCPALASATGSSFGVIPNITSAAPCGSCTSSTAEGIPPFMSLGISPTIAHDGWGHWITMRVDPALTVLPTNPTNCASTNSCSVFVPPQAACTSTDVSNGFCSSAGLSQKGMCVANLRISAKAVPIQVYQGSTSTFQPAAIMYVSHGSKGYGAYIANVTTAGAGYLNGCRLPFTNGAGTSGSCPSQPTCISGGAYTCTTGICQAECNASGGIQFINAAQASDYDDLMVYADRNTFVSMFGNGSCQTVW